jgi:Protein of unknown function DUF262
MRISELIRDVENGTLVLRPIFQRRLVWTNTVKDRFLETVRLGLPFPEIFVATGEIDTTTMRRKNWLVDGQQRISTLRQYVQGSKDLVLKIVKPYSELTEHEKKQFLDYEVAVRDLGMVTEQQIKDIFSRINSTDYALKAMERMNALYNGAYIQFCEELSTNSFFQKHNVFSMADWRRMRDLDFCVILVTTLLSTYYNRDEKNREFLNRYNDEFVDSDRVQAEIAKVFDFVEGCSFAEKSRVWKKTDLFTLLVEIHSALVVKGLAIETDLVGKRLEQFYSRVDELYATKPGTAELEAQKPGSEVFRYLKAATKATNDKYARADRGEIIARHIMATLPKAENKPASKPKRARKT